MDVCLCVSVIYGVVIYVLKRDCAFETTLRTISLRLFVPSILSRRGKCTPRPDPSTMRHVLSPRNHAVDPSGISATITEPGIYR